VSKKSIYKKKKYVFSKKNIYIIVQSIDFTNVMLYHDDDLSKKKTKEEKAFLVLSSKKGEKCTNNIFCFLSVHVRV